MRQRSVVEVFSIELVAHVVDAQEDVPRLSQSNGSVDVERGESRRSDFSQRRRHSLLIVNDSSGEHEVPIGIDRVVVPPQSQS